MISGTQAPQDLEQIPVLELLPQRPPFVMIDALTAFDERHTSTRLTVRPSNVFYEMGRLTAYGLVENIAQTCAARLGYASYVLHRPPRIGVIGAINHFDVLRTPLKDETIRTDIEVEEEVLGITLINARVFVGSELIAASQMKIALTGGEAPKTDTP